MELQQASKSQSRMRLALLGPSGSGKTYGALLIASGLTGGDWTKVAVIDTENRSAHLYSHLGLYNVISLNDPYSPERFSNGIRLAEEAGQDVIIIDSASFEWNGPGGILDIHGAMTGNSFQNWSRVTPRHNAFIQTILSSSAHVIATVRSKQDYILTDKAGKLTPEKVGLRGIQKDEFEYDFDLAFEIDIKHNATATKDRTSLFMDKPAFKLSPFIGEQIRNWCNQGTPSFQRETVIRRIEDAKSLGELLTLYKHSPGFQTSLHDHFSRRRKELEVNQTVHQLLNKQNQPTNGQHDFNEG
jgi:hypothetical protein